MLPYAREEMSMRWVCQQDDDLKHASKLEKYWFFENKKAILEWSTQSADFKLIEKLWRDIKQASCLEGTD